ncbi:GNAT family N-acetyltransferase [uncultured Clostridium sp.]|mgnify:CR=1 FL=1|uniref:GNAT family N-acetyltransferase n=1 Tax=uncultured Clostridium sp. TaxID=59620 RepID=UPI0025E7748F|nr:GNAT family N-acetyltransferase [uncultured Clostridium sp.]
MMDISIRKGTEKDSELISRIYAESWRSAYKGMVPDEYLDDFWIDSFQKWLSEDIFKVKIIYADHKAAGAGAYGKSRDDKFADYAEICSFYLRPEYFRKGMGTALMKSVIDEIYNEG